MFIPKYNKKTARIFSLFLTEECDKTCYYCDIPYKKNKLSTNKKLLYKYLPILENEGSFLRYTITGGEAGLVDDDVFDFIFETIDTTKHPIKVNTNGLFYSTGLYDKYKDYIDEVGYHPIIDPNENLPLDFIDEKTIVYIPFNRKNMNDVRNLLCRYPNVKFNPIPYICKKTFDNEDYVLDRQHILDVKDSIINLDNLAPGTFTSILTTMTSNAYDSGRIICQNSGTKYSFNFASGYIGRCPESISLNDKYEMNIDNINKAINFNLFPKVNSIIDDACKQCYYFDSFLPYALRNTFIDIHN